MKRGSFENHDMSNALKLYADFGSWTVLRNTLQSYGNMSILKTILLCTMVNSSV